MLENSGCIFIRLIFANSLSSQLFRSDFTQNHFSSEWLFILLYATGNRTFLILEDISPDSLSYPYTSS